MLIKTFGGKHDVQFIESTSQFWHKVELQFKQRPEELYKVEGQSYKHFMRLKNKDNKL